jgi:hypothetical protein
MQTLEISGAVRPLQGSLGVKGLRFSFPRRNILRLKDVHEQPKMLNNKNSFVVSVCVRLRGVDVLCMNDCMHRTVN